MGLESSRYSRIQIAMRAGSDPGSYDLGGRGGGGGGGGSALSVGA